MKTHEEIIKDVNEHLFLELISMGIMDDVKKAMDKYAEQTDKYIDNFNKISIQQASQIIKDVIK